MSSNYLDTDTFSYSASQTYANIINDLHLAEELSSRGSSRSTPTGSSTSISAFIRSFESREPFANEEVDLRALEYVTPPNDNLVCAICASPFVNPFELGCEHIFCEECIYEHLQSGIQSASLCPKCRRPMEQLHPVPKLLNQLLDELEVECPNSSLGCHSPVKRYTINHHVYQYCDYGEVPCSSKDCNQSIQRRFADQSCLHSYVECECCDNLVMEKDLIKHQHDDCPQGSTICGHCMEEYYRSEIQQHLREECPKVRTSCPGKPLGCTFRDYRKVISEHALSCPMAIMLPHFQEQKERQAELEETNNLMRERITELDLKLEELESNCKQLASTIKKERRRSMIPPEGTVSASRIEEVTNRVDEMASDYTSRLDNATTENARMHMAFMNESIRSQQQFHTINAALTALRTQVNHLTTRAAGSSGSNGSTAAGARGGGVALDSARRLEPPKL